MQAWNAVQTASEKGVAMLASRLKIAGYPEAAARRQGADVEASMDELRKLLPRVASYVWETDFFQPNW